MALSSVLGDTASVLAAIGAADALVYRRVTGGRYRLVAAPGAGLPSGGAQAELLADDEPVVTAALATGLRRVACEQPRQICGGYVARAAAVVAVQPDVIVVLGRHDGCLAAVSNEELVAAARVVAGEAGPA